jgi:hypothetical protein
MLNRDDYTNIADQAYDTLAEIESRIRSLVIEMRDVHDIE